MTRQVGEVRALVCPNPFRNMLMLVECHCHVEEGKGHGRQQYKHKVTPNQHSRLFAPSLVHLTVMVSCLAYIAPAFSET
jgi:hypothetical protein